MEDLSSEFPTPPELNQPVENIIRGCLNLHKNFDKEWKNQGRISYHNENHVRATLVAAEKLVKAAFNIENPQDPLGLKNDLNKWNELNPEGKVTEEEFLDVVRLAFSFHDLGNIAKLNEKGEIEYLDIYRAQGAEERSVQIAEKIINESSLTDDQKKRFLPLVSHLIRQTTYQPSENDKGRPFASSARVIDQVGGNLFNGQEARVLGLIEENVHESEGGDFSFTPNKFFNFVRIRFPQLVDDENLRIQITQIFGVSLPEEIPNLKDQNITLTQSDLPIRSLERFKI